MSSPTQFVKTYGNTCGISLGEPFGSGVKNVSIANAFRNLGKFFESVGIGARGFNGYVVQGGAQATGTVTFSSLANNNTITVNGVVFTAKTSGATGNNQFNLGANDTAAAVNFAAALNSSGAPAKIIGVVSASPAAAVTTITFIEAGAIGNLGTLAISANGSVSAANLAGGTDGTFTPLAKGL